VVLRKFLDDLSMIGGMDWLATFPQLIDAVGNLGALIMQAVAERLLTLLLAGLLIGGIGAFAIAAFAWLWAKRVAAGLRLRPSPTPR
jgi:hypothetical protein